MKDSARDFQAIVCPKLKECGFIIGDVIHVEAVTESEMAKALDQYAGIDAWIIQDSRGITGLASRVQWTLQRYNTFTLRAESPWGGLCEYDKRLMAIKSNGELLYPYWTSQAYITERKVGSLLSVAMAKTIDIINLINDGYWLPGANEKEWDYKFKIVPWDWLPELNILINRWDGNLTELESQKGIVKFPMKRQFPQFTVPKKEEEHDNRINIPKPASN